MPEKCPCCNRGFKNVWEYPLIEITNIEKVTLESLPKILTLSNEEKLYCLRRNLPTQAGLVFRRMFGTLKFLDDVALAPNSVLEYFSENPNAKRFTDEQGLVYSRHRHYPKAIVCAPNRAPEIKEAIFEDFALRDYLARLESFTGKILPPGILNPGFSDFFELKSQAHARSQFLSLFLNPSDRKEEVYIEVGIAKENTPLVIFRETQGQVIKVATVHYRGVF